MVFSNSCNPSPSTLSAPIKLSTKLENELLKNGLLSPQKPSRCNQSPIRKEFYSVINQSYSIQQELDKTEEKLNISLKIQTEQEEELQTVKEKVLKLKEELNEKINKIKEFQNEAKSNLKKLKVAEDENLIMKTAIFELKEKLRRLTNEADTIRIDTINDLNDVKAIFDKSDADLRLIIAQLIENNNNHIPDVFYDDLNKIKETSVLDDAESLHNSSTVSENSQTSNFYFLSNSQPEPNQIFITTNQHSNRIPTWFIIISGIIMFLFLWIKINGSLFGQQPHFEVYYTSLPPS